jgi:small redox-active disulfide protein 2
MAEQLIKVFGGEPPCAKCKATERVAIAAVTELGLSAKVVHISAMSEEADKYDIMLTPAVVINEKVVLSGKVPTKEEFKMILQKEIGGN